MRQKLVYIVLGIALVVGMFALPLAPAAQAGSNGQQLRFIVGCQYAPAIDGVEVNGVMWNEQVNTKRWTFAPTRDITIWGWWWKSVPGRDVKISYHFVGKNPATGYPYSWYSFYVYVPKSYPTDVYTINLTTASGLQCNPY